MTLDKRTLNRDETIAGLERPKVKAAISDAFAGLVTGSTIQPAEVVTEFPGGGGDCIFYPGLVGGAQVVGIKVSPYVAARETDGMHPVTAYTLLLSTTTGEPLLFCDSFALVTARTAATTSIALDHLMPEKADRLALLGAGGVGLEHLRYVCGDRKWEDVSIFSPSLADPSSSKHRDRRESLEAVDFEVSIAPSAEDAVREADVVILCTSASGPPIDMSWLGETTVVTSITNHELDPSWIAKFAVFCDYRKTAPVTAAEMVQAIDRGLWDPQSIMADLPELVTGNAVRPSATRTLFRSTGLGLEDMAIASLLT